MKRKRNITSGATESFRDVCLYNVVYVFIMYQTGDDITQFIGAYNAIHMYLIAMGARLAPAKSYIFSTAPNFRIYLSTFVWKHLGCVVQVVMSFRDLGAHLNLSKGANATTLTNRILSAITSVNRIRWLPHDLKQKIIFIINGALAKGLWL